MNGFQDLKFAARAYAHRARPRLHGARHGGFVNRYFPNEDPIGKRLEVAFSTHPVWREIVGVVADVRSDGLDQDTPVQVYTAFLQKPGFLGLPPRAITVLARTMQDPALLGAPMKAAILNVDRSQPVYDVQPMTTVVSQSIAPRRLSLILLAFFALSALFLASLGLDGVMSYSVTQRTPEIGIRMALGARRCRPGYRNLRGTGTDPCDGVAAFPRRFRGRAHVLARGRDSGGGVTSGLLSSRPPRRESGPDHRAALRLAQAVFPTWQFACYRFRKANHFPRGSRLKQ